MKRLRTRQARGKNGVNGRLEICDQISEARARNNEPNRWFLGLRGPRNDCASPKQEAQPETLS